MTRSDPRCRGDTPAITFTAPLDHPVRPFPVRTARGEVPLVIDPGPDTQAPAPAAPVVPAAAAPIAHAVPAEPTLHDFVLKLLQDPTSMKAFDLDPQGCLNSAGLHDLTPADVHDVIPLVTDLVPTGGLDNLQSISSALDIDSGAGIDGGWGKFVSAT